MHDEFVRQGSWANPNELAVRRYTCGFCGRLVASDRGYFHQHQAGNDRVGIRICPNCKHPSYFEFEDVQVPGVPYGSPVEHLPDDVNALYSEIRRCTAGGAYTAAVMAARKLLMNIAVNQGAQPGESFLDYVDYLAARGFVPPHGKTWVDHIRNKGNEANHEIRLMGKADAEEIVTFIEMLLKFIYEFPARVPPPPTAAGNP